MADIKSLDDLKSAVSGAAAPAAAEVAVRERGLSFLMGVWQYLDKDDRDWHTCIIKC